MADEGSGDDLPTLSGPGGSGTQGPSRPLPEVEGYEILGPLGEGGMGTVWRAVQQATRREVALKLLRTGAFGSEKARLRFDREVELAARLEHPHIARVYDSGICQGESYYAMELVAGVALDEYVAQHRLGQQQILALMETVCRAVQHAHQRGVIHRDLKPSNILVTPDGQPHVLDFGLAKAVLEGQADVSVTVQGEVAGTPAYMAPEQAAGRVDAIDTRSDVYSLGVILYRLLIGTSPHDLSGTPYELMRRLVEEEVRRPRDLTKAVDRELEVLLLKALAHDPERRYASAGDMADDIRNYLTHEPLTAKSPTTVYFLRKRLRKYRGRVTVAALMVGALLGMAVWSYVRVAEERDRAVTAEADAVAARDEARDEAAKATAVTEFLRETLSSIDPAAARGREVTVREVFDKAAKKVGTKFADRPLVQAAVRETLGVTYLALGDSASACSHLSAAVDLRLRHLGQEHPDTLKAMNDLAMVWCEQGRYVEAERTHRQVLGIRQRVLGQEHPSTLASMNSLANALYGQGKDAEAALVYNAVLSVQRRVLGEEQPGTLGTMANLAAVMDDHGMDAEAEAMYRQVLEIRLQVLGDDHPDTLASMNNLATFLCDRGKAVEAERLHRQALRTRQWILGNEHPDTLASMNNLAVALCEQGNGAEGAAIFRQVLEVQQRVLGAEHPHTLKAMSNVATVLCDQRKYAEAETISRQVLEIRRRVLGKLHPDTLASRDDLAGILEAQGKTEEAKALRE